MSHIIRVVGDIQYELIKSKDKYSVYVYERFSQEMICLITTTDKSKALEFYTKLLCLHDITLSYKEKFFGN